MSVSPGLFTAYYETFRDGNGTYRAKYRSDFMRGHLISSPRQPNW